MLPSCIWFAFEQLVRNMWNGFNIIYQEVFVLFFFFGYFILLKLEWWWLMIFKRCCLNFKIDSRNFFQKNLVLIKKITQHLWFGYSRRNLLHVDFVVLLKKNWYEYEEILIYLIFIIDKSTFSF